MSDIQLLSFDLDDTLWPCYPTIYSAENKLYEFLQNHAPKITQRLSIDQLREKRMLFLEQRPDLKHDLTALRLESLKALATEFEIDDAWVSDAFQVYYDARQKVTLYDDVAVTLDQLNNHYRLVAVSNGNACIKETGVSHWFEFSVSAADVGFMKPHPAMFEALLQQSNCSADEVVHIGDDAHHDIYGAKQLGIRTVWLNRDGKRWQHQDCEPDFQIRSLVELPELLQDLRV